MPSLELLTMPPENVLKLPSLCLSCCVGSFRIWSRILSLVWS
ncbi:MAG: hypothetical protein ACTTIC_02765 [Helicobacteraceae bacterium]